MTTPPRGQVSHPATLQDEERYFAAYASYADAMVAAARRHGQDIAFFWEYWLGDMGDIKPLSDREGWLYAQVRRAPEQTAYAMRMRDRWVGDFARQNVPFLGEIPLFTEIREGGDRGMPIVVSAPNHAAGKVFIQIAETVRKNLG